MTSTPTAGDAPVDRSGGPIRLAVALAVAALVVTVDQLTKTWAVHRLSRGPIHVVGPLDLQLTTNTGVSFSQLQGQTALLVTVAVVLCAVLVALAWRSPSRGRAAVVGLVLGGALGNLADRFFRGSHAAVVDFIELHVWPTFNVADSCVVVGCLLLVVSLFRASRPGARSTGAEAQGTVARSGPAGSGSGSGGSDVPGGPGRPVHDPVDR